MATQKTITLQLVLSDTFVIIKKRWVRLVGIILITLIGLGLLFLILYLVQATLISTNIITHQTVPLYRLISYFIGLILFLIISALIQILIVTTFIFPQRSLIEDLKKAPQFLVQFILFTLIISILFLLANAPFYGALPLILFDESILGVISILVGVVLNVLLAVYFFSAPFIMVERGVPALTAIKKSARRISGSVGPVTFLLILLAAILVILQTVGFLSKQVPFIGQLISLIILICMIVLSSSFVYALYKKLA